MNKILLLSSMLIFSGCSTIDIAQKSKNNDWIKLHTMTTMYGFYLSKKSIQVVSDSPKIIRVTSKMQNISSINTTFLDRGNYLLGTDEIDCTQNMTKTLSGATYKKDGTLLVKQDMPDPIFKKVTPDSLGEEIMKIACAL